MILHELLNYDTLRLIWWLLIGVLLVGFAVTDGFDLGSGILLPFAARNDLERRVVINSVGPVWEGNQVWLILGGGAVFAAWPQLYAVSFSGFYLAMFVILTALILRPVAFKFRSKREEPRWRQRWDAVLFFSGFVPALIFGVAMGNVLQGVPFRFGDDMHILYDGSFFGLLNPFALLAGLVSVAMLVMHGAAWLVLKTDGPVAERARAYGMVAALVTVVLYAIAGGVLWGFVDGYRITSLVDVMGPSNPLHKTAELRAGAWFTNYAAHPWTLTRCTACTGGTPWRPGFVGGRARHRRHHPERRCVDVSVHPAIVDRPARQPHGLGLVVEPADAVHHARHELHLHAHHPRLHHVGLPRAVGQGRSRRHPRRERTRLLGHRHMWYFSWILGLPLAAAFAVLNAMWYELMDDDAIRKEKLETREAAHGQERL
jgi:cytochrome bd ubiquinol oxidase subunit II